MNYKETVDFLYSALPMFGRTGAAALKKDLTNTLLLCNKLGNPQHNFKSVHVAGTNGKGSVSHMLAAVLQTAGYTTGLYTSPHLKDFRERIKVNGVMIEEDFVVSFTESIKPLIEEIKPSFFEITVAMAFAYFSDKQVDIAVIETGLGGRLDSTNVIMPVLSVITNIGMDHMNILGDSLAQIAWEKAGIIKPGIPVVVGETLPETQAVFEAAATEKNALLIWANRERYADSYSYNKQELSVEMVYTSHNDKQNYILDLPGIYQVKNLVTLLAAIDQLKKTGWHIPEQAAGKGLRNVKALTGLHGRWETIRHHPEVVLDVGHNEDGIRQITEQLELMSYHNLHIVIGMVKDKEIEKVMQLLPKEASYYFTKAQTPRALPEDQLAAIAAEHGLTGHHFPAVNMALQNAIDHAHKDDLVLVCGSVFVVGEVSLA
ncbi:folylpolyglutamate synthase/dihydrofolate synthase family protein [Agriterribacter sp.]|uniref:bifunctional folylpolyglutamate synthase/dihydrofolate synthase n=1 Tax=Agriterribacter sp. TaxID=2821509 RepID=UPI002CFEE952|nr:folylpolyglutamate synthase/dihydrofolate synthase family protein [Agriterribacter sp.]HTN06642.1 folylpolyglutamate synthase/dihydrofolate synthase family protein [Agriterribacter sp.]